jgi:hypothetical protein
LVQANPPAAVTWRHQGADISSFDPGYSLLDDFSLQINSVGDFNAGTYTVSADNGVRFGGGGRGGQRLRFQDFIVISRETLGRTECNCDKLVVFMF